MNRTGLLSRVLVLVTLLLPAPAAAAQTDTARIQGTVTDTTGAAIPAAAITVTNLKTGALFKTRSDGAGNFTVSALPAGKYKVDVQIAGFQGQVQDFSLAVSQVRTINFKLAAVRPPRRSRPRAPPPVPDTTVPPQVRSSRDSELADPLLPTQATAMAA